MTWKTNIPAVQHYEQAMDRLRLSGLPSLQVAYIAGCVTRALDAATALPPGIEVTSQAVPTRADDIGMLIQTRDLLRSTQPGALEMAQRRLEDYLNRYNR